MQTGNVRPVLDKETLKRAVPIKAFDGKDGLVVEEGILRAYRDGALVESVDSQKLAEAREADPAASEMGYAAPLAMPEVPFCYAAPVFVSSGRVLVGNELLVSRGGSAALADVYDPDFETTFDGEIIFGLADVDGGNGGILSNGGNSNGMHEATWTTWSKAFSGNVSDEAEEKYKRLVSLNLPLNKAHQQDVALLTRLAREVCDLVDLYVVSEGEIFETRVRGLNNGFVGGLPAPHKFAPLLFGRNPNNIYLALKNPRVPD